jgi:aspartate kinase
LAGELFGGLRSTSKLLKGLSRINMPLLVQKYGGSSVATIERIKHVAEKVCAAQRAGHDLVVVVSAMAGETNRLLGLAHEISEMPDEREKDVLLASGEQVSIALLSLALKERGQPSRSFLGHQVRIETDNAYGKARIRNIDSKRIMQSLKAGEVVVVAGFQGIDEDDNITTLGRGGSDTTAVALAAFLNASACEIYTDVEGVFTTDPGICADAQKLPRVSYEEMIELASTGAKVLEIRSVEFAKRFAVPVHVRSSFSDVEGTWVVKEDESMEDLLVSGVSYDKNEVKITILRVPDRPGLAAQVFGPIADAHIVVDMIIQNASADGTTDLTFTVSKADYKKALSIVEKTAPAIEAKGVDVDTDIAKVSVVGVGMRTHAGVAAKMFRVLAEEGVNIEMISTSEIKISVVIAAKYTELAVRVLHEAFIGKQGNV